MKRKRDLTAAQFEHRARKLGCTPEGFLGYWKLPDRSTCVSVLNAGRRRRDQLNYLRRKIRKLNP